MHKVTYTVNCPRDAGQVYIMSILVTQLENGKYLASPCNGCENLSGSPICNRCIESLFDMSQKDATMKSYKQPITP